MSTKLCLCVGDLPRVPALLALSPFWVAPVGWLMGEATHLCEVINPVLAHPQARGLNFARFDPFSLCWMCETWRCPLEKVSSSPTKDCVCLTPVSYSNTPCCWRSQIPWVTPKEVAAHCHRGGDPCRTPSRSPVLAQPAAPCCSLL